MSSTLTETSKEELTACENLTSTIKKLIKMLKDKQPNNMDIDRIQQLLKLAYMLEHDFIMKRVVPKIWLYKEHIMLMDEKKLFGDEFGTDMIKKDKRAELIKRLLKLVKDTFKSASKKEKELVWTEIKSILECVLIYIKVRPKAEIEALIKAFQAEDSDSEENEDSDDE
jgi:hypothetical protein